MKIIYLHQYFNTPEMTGGTRSYEMARRMVSAGHEVHLITSYRENGVVKGDWFTTTEAGINVHWFPVLYSNHMSNFERIRAFFLFAMAAKNKAISLGGDVVFATSTPLTIVIPAIPAAKKNKIPMVFEVRDLWPEMPIAMGALNNPVLRYLARKLEMWAYKNSSSIVALSPGMKEGVVKTGYPSSRVAVIPNSSDNSEFKHDSQAASEFRSSRFWLRDKPLLVYTGTFGKVNGVDYLVNLAGELKKINSDIKILLVGDGQEREAVIKKAKQLSVFNDNVFFEAKIPKNKVPGLLSAANLSSALFIDLPEMRPNSANKFFDALASSTPILLNYGGWMHNLVKGNGCGLAMWQKPLDQVASELESCMYDEKWLLESGEAARRLGESSFDRDILAGHLIELLESVVSGESEKAEKIAPGIYL
jgi:glycosyltransferase involved in cell wall biosynthesis